MGMAEGDVQNNDTKTEQDAPTTLPYTLNPGAAVAILEESER